MQNAKRKVFTSAMALLIVASVGAGTSLAAQNDDEKPPTKEGYVVKDGKKTPVSQDDAAYPKLPKDPNEPVPKTGTTTTDTAKMGNTIYFEGEGTTDFGDGVTGKVYLEKKSDGKIELGVYDPKTYKKTRDPVSDERDEIGEKEMVKKYGPAYAWSKAFDGTTKLKRETRYELVKSSVVDRAAQYNFSQAVRHGVAKSDLFGFSSTIGSKVSVETGGGFLPGKVTAELSTELTSKFEKNITVTNETTTTESFTAPKVDNPDYKEPVYTGAAYQLKSTYTVVPGDGLKELINENYDGGMDLKSKELANPSYKYAEDQMYFGLTPGSHENDD
ncbi:hypothetical protein SAMN05444487_105194 [Marininema mesophilum]|uniref:Uncharacterized protein n=1 Tax=Marininema mesophilum TaxID=1048340 RepID=A0A1H2VSD7_9BACL|nr:hypothetical protein [Marininema mesophilum]SDW71198.1 hypothetical protein SAMN05444487_105194 [Marininema mesophilum]